MNNLPVRQSYQTAVTDCRRAYERVELRGTVIIHNEENLFIAPLKNLSRGGVYIEILTALPVGTTVFLVIKSPDLVKPAQAKGTIVRITEENHKGTAVRFFSPLSSTDVLMRSSSDHQWACHHTCSPRSRYRLGMASTR